MWAMIEWLLSWFAWYQRPVHRDAWLYLYLAQALECDVPILEAIYHAQIMTYEQGISFVRGRVSQQFIKNGWRPHADGWIKGHPSCNRICEVEEKLSDYDIDWLFSMGSRQRGWIAISHWGWARSSMDHGFHLTRANLDRRVTGIVNSFN